MKYSCPKCGWETDELPDAVKVEINRAKQHRFYDEESWDEEKLGPKLVYHSKGHSDQSTHICPLCQHEGWFQGWTMEGTPEA